MEIALPEDDLKNRVEVSDASVADGPKTPSDRRIDVPHHHMRAINLRRLDHFGTVGQVYQLSLDID